jgi:hypothetical protein
MPWQRAGVSPRTLSEWIENSGTWCGNYEYKCVFHKYKNDSCTYNAKACIDVSLDHRTPSRGYKMLATQRPRKKYSARLGATKRLTESGLASPPARHSRLERTACPFDTLSERTAWLCEALETPIGPTLGRSDQFSSGEFLRNFGGKISGEWLLAKAAQLAEKAPGLWSAADRSLKPQTGWSGS